MNSQENGMLEVPVLCLSDGANRHGVRIRKCSKSIIWNGMQVVLNFEDNHRWELPGGGIEEGETPDQACIREVKEETGLDVQIEMKVAVLQVNEELNPELFDVLEVHLFLCKPFGSELNVDTSLTPEEAAQGCESHWLKPNDAIEKIDSIPDERSKFSKWSLKWLKTYSKEI